MAASKKPRATVATVDTPLPVPPDHHEDVPPGSLPSVPLAGQVMLESVNLDKMPTYATSDVARFFFLRSGAWLRWKEGEGSFYNPVTGETVQPARDMRNARRYTLLDIERLAHAMYANGSIQMSQLLVIKHLVWWTAVGGGVPFVPPVQEEAPTDPVQ